MRVTPKNILLDGDMSGDLETESQQLNQQFGYSVQAIFSTAGTLGGTLALQASLDNVIFSTIPDSEETISGEGSFIWNVTSSMYPYMRCIYTAAGGDEGVLNVNFFGRGF